MEMQAIDRMAQEKYGIPGATLMEQAALAILKALQDKFGDLAGKRIYICCGKGNNGGDGFALARLAREAGAEVTAVLLYRTEEYRGLAATNLDLARESQIKLCPWPDLSSQALAQADLIVDAILGTGSSGPPTGIVAEVIEALNLTGKPIVAVDLPSGINVDTGQVPGVAIRANLTVSFGLLKPGLITYPGTEFCGELVLDPIGFPVELLQNEALQTHYLTDFEAKALLPIRKATAHKGTTGHLGIIGGSPGLTGAVALAALGGLRIGCGLASVGLREGVSFPEKPLEVMVRSWAELKEQWPNFNCLVIGPGLSTAADGEAILFELIKQTNLPLVIDADALNMLATKRTWQAGRKAATVFTPHPGEMARLTGLSVAELQADRLGVARRFAKEWQVTVVLKGAGTVIATPDGQAYINLTGNPGMATAGMGDVLAGVIGGLIAQGSPVTEAAVLGTYIHGMAGDLVASRQGPVGMIASDLLRMIPLSIKKVLN